MLISSSFLPMWSIKGVSKCYHFCSTCHSSGTLLRREIIRDFDKLAVMQPLLLMPGNRWEGIASLLGYLVSALAWVFGELLKHSAVDKVTWLGWSRAWILQMGVVFQPQFSSSLEGLLARHLKHWIIEVVAHYLIQGVIVTHPQSEEETLLQSGATREWNVLLLPLFVAKRSAHFGVLT